VPHIFLLLMPRHNFLHSCLALLSGIVVLPSTHASSQWSLRHSYSLTTFSPEGRLEQLEHAAAAADAAPPVVAMRGAGCVVLVACEPDLGPLVEASGTPKVMAVSLGPGDGASSSADRASNGCVVMAYAGMGGDARSLGLGAQAACLSHWSTLGEGISAGGVSAHLAQVLQAASQQGGTRPYGCAVLVASGGNGDWDTDCGGSGSEEDSSRGPQLWHLEPSGRRWPVHASAVGLGATALREALAKRWQPGMSAVELEALGRDLLRDHCSLGELRSADDDDDAEGSGSQEEGSESLDSDNPSGVLKRPQRYKAASRTQARRRWQGTGFVEVAVVRTGVSVPELDRKYC